MNTMNIDGLLGLFLAILAATCFLTFLFNRVSTWWKKDSPAFILTAKVKEVSDKAYRKATGKVSLKDYDSIQLSYSLDKRMFFDSHYPNRETFLKHSEILNQVNLYVDNIKGDFSKLKDYSFLSTAIKSQEVFNDNDVLVMFSIANSSTRNREAFIDLYNHLFVFYCETENLVKNRKPAERELFQLISTNNHQLYSDIKAWIDAVVEADKVNDVELTCKEKIKTKLNAFMGKYEFKTDYSGTNDFLALPVEWQIDMIFDDETTSVEPLLSEKV